jgi:hypothetical protein
MFRLFFQILPVLWLCNDEASVALRARLSAGIFEAGLLGFAACMTPSAVMFSSHSLVIIKIAVIRVLSVSGVLSAEM